MSKLEEFARQKIDAALQAAGWSVQDYQAVSLLRATASMSTARCASPRRTTKDASDSSAMARPPFALERIEQMTDGSISYLMKTARRGSTHRVMTLVEFMARLAILVPPPYFPLVRYRGVLAARSSWRAFMTPKPPDGLARPKKSKPCRGAETDAMAAAPPPPASSAPSQGAQPMDRTETPANAPPSPALASPSSASLAHAEGEAASSRAAIALVL